MSNRSPRLVVRVRYGETRLGRVLRATLPPTTPCVDPVKLAAGLRLSYDQGIDELNRGTPLIESLGSVVLIERRRGKFRLAHVARWPQLIIRTGTNVDDVMDALHMAPRGKEVVIDDVSYGHYFGRDDDEWVLRTLEECGS